MNRRAGPVLLRYLWLGVFCLCGCLWSPHPSLATQKGSWEIGLDMGAEFTSRNVTNYFYYSESTTVRRTLVDIPQASFRAGYFFTDAFSLEPSLGLSWTLRNPDTAVADWQMRVGLKATYALKPSSRVSPFFSTGVSARSVPSGAPFTPSDIFGVPVEVGVRVRVGRDSSIRLQSGVIASFDPGAPGAYRTIPVRIGWSLNTKESARGAQ